MCVVPGHEVFNAQVGGDCLVDGAALSREDDQRLAQKLLRASSSQTEPQRRCVPSRLIHVCGALLVD